MNRNTAILWTLLSTLLCGWPGICMLSIGIPAAVIDPKHQSDLGTVLFLMIGFIFLVFPILNVFYNFRSSKITGIIGLVLVTVLSGLLQFCGAFIFLIAAGAASDTTGLMEIILTFLISGFFLVNISILIWFIGVRSSASNKASITTTFLILVTILYFGLPGVLNLIYMIFVGGLLHVILLPKDATMFGLQDIIMLATSLTGVALPFLVWFFRSRFRKPAEVLTNELSNTDVS